jgi:hypothetical protein
MVCADRNLAVSIDDLRPTDCKGLTRKDDSAEDHEETKTPLHEPYPHLFIPMIYTSILPLSIFEGMSTTAGRAAGKIVRRLSLLERAYCSRK